MPKVSVIIPNYNHAAYLQQRINSVLNQSYTDFELIILDDCSTDNSKEIIEEYRSNKKVRHIIYNTLNSGNTFHQWDKGIQLAAGEYIWIAESDDWCETDLLQTIMTGLKKNKDAAFGYCQSFCINNKENIIFQSKHNKLEEYCSKENYLERYLTFGNAVFNAGMAVFRKRFYYSIRDFYKTFRFTGDWVFWAELSRLGDVYINARPLNYFRKHDKDVSGKMYASGSNFIEEIKVLDYFHEHLNLNTDLYFNAKIKLYNRFISGKKNIDQALKNQVKQLIFKNISFLRKQYFLVLSYLYQFKTGLNKSINKRVQVKY